MTNKDRREFVKTAGKFSALVLGASTILSPLNAQGEQDFIKNSISNGEPTKGFGVDSNKSKFKPMTFSRHPMAQMILL